MKKYLKFLGLMIAVATLFSSCSFIADYIKDKIESEGGSESSVKTIIDHEFYLSDDKSSYVYYTSTQKFDYTYEGETHYNCVYQISFSPTNSSSSRGTWKLYTRPIASTSTIEMVFSGDFEGVNNGSIRTGGKVELLKDGELYDTLTIKEKTVTTATGLTKTAYAFTANVAVAHAKIGAVDAK